MTDKEEYIKRLDKIQNDLDLLREELRVFIRYTLKKDVPSFPNVPNYDPYPSTICPKCGMEWKGVMGYVCTNQPCPIQPSPTYSGGYLNEK